MGTLTQIHKVQVPELKINLKFLSSQETSVKNKSITATGSMILRFRNVTRALQNATRI